MISLLVPGNPLSQNRAYRRRGKGGRLFMTDEAKGWKAAIAYRARAAMKRDGLSTIEGLVAVRVRVVFDSRRPDMDGPLKLVLDALQLGQVYKNDRQVEELHLSRGLDREKPRLEVEVWPIGAVRVNELEDQGGARWLHGRKPCHVEPTPEPEPKEKP